MPFLEVFFSSVLQFSVTLLNPVTSDPSRVFDCMNPLSISNGNSSLAKRSISSEAVTLSHDFNHRRFGSRSQPITKSHALIYLRTILIKVTRTSCLLSALLGKRLVGYFLWTYFERFCFVAGLKCFWLLPNRKLACIGRRVPIIFTLSLAVYSLMIQPAGTARAMRLLILP
jgi:hypothetical protein